MRQMILFSGHFLMYIWGLNEQQEFDSHYTTIISEICNDNGIISCISKKKNLIRFEDFSAQLRTIHPRE